MVGPFLEFEGLMHHALEAARLHPGFARLLEGAHRPTCTEGKPLLGVDPVVVEVAASLTEGLSDRELEVLGLVAMGLSNAEASRKLFIAPSTVKKHLEHIYGKLGVNRRTQAVARARTLGLI